MREIKFRAWDEKNQAMIYPKGILFDGRVVNFMCGMLEPFDGYKLMQYTGLKDKNGKEIYETDLIQHMDPVTLETLTSEVYWNEKGYWAVRDKNGKFVDLLHRTELPEVIGNIYENPELLKGEKNA